MKYIMKFLYYIKILKIKDLETALLFIYRTKYKVSLNSHIHIPNIFIRPNIQLLIKDLEYINNTDISNSYLWEDNKYTVNFKTYVIKDWLYPSGYIDTDIDKQFIVLVKLYIKLLRKYNYIIKYRHKPIESWNSNKIRSYIVNIEELTKKLELL